MKKAKTLIFVLLFSTCILFAAGGCETKTTPPRRGLKDIRNYVCYYGPDKVNEMSNFDAVILEARHHSKNDIAQLKNSGTLAIGYITIGEDDLFHKNADWYFDRDKDGKPDKNANWNSWYADARSTNWRAHVVHKKARAVLVEKECDGIFLDTIDTAQLYPESRDGMIQLIRELREAYPRAIILQNRGFDVISDTADMVDGLMYEAFSVHYNFNDKTYARLSDSNLRWSRQLAVNTLAPLMKKTGLVVLALDYAEPGQKELIQFAYDRARHFGFVPYVATINLQKIFIRQIAPKLYREPSTEAKGKPAPTRADGNLCRMTGTTVRVDSSFQGYSPNALTDGYRHEENLEWYERSWASAERPGPHEATVSFSAAKNVRRVLVYWAVEGKDVMASTRVDLLDDKGHVAATFLPKKEKDGSVKPISEVAFSVPRKLTAIRLRQPAGAGPEGRTNIMWLAEIEAYE